jgi:hypothetical protein
MRTQKLAIIEPVNGFTEREASSKAILNTDTESLLKYKIQKRKMSEINKTRMDMTTVQQEIDCMKNDLCEIKQLLLQITKRVE